MIMRIFKCIHIVIWTEVFLNLSSLVLFSTTPGVGGSIVGPKSFLYMLLLKTLRLKNYCSWCSSALHYINLGLLFQNIFFSTWPPFQGISWEHIYIITFYLSAYHVLFNSYAEFWLRQKFKMAANMAPIKPLWTKYFAFGTLWWASSFKYTKVKRLKNVQYSWKGTLYTFTHGCSSSRHRPIWVSCLKMSSNNNN